MLAKTLQSITEEALCSHAVGRSGRWGGVLSKEGLRKTISGSILVISGLGERYL